MVCSEDEGKHIFWWALATPETAAWLDASVLVVCSNKCTNSGPDVGRALMSLASSHFCHAEEDEKYLLMALGAVSWELLERESVSLGSDCSSGSSG